VTLFSKLYLLQKVSFSESLWMRVEKFETSEIFIFSFTKNIFLSSIRGGAVVAMLIRNDENLFNIKK